MNNQFKTEVYTLYYLWFACIIIFSTSVTIVVSIQKNIFFYWSLFFLIAIIPLLYSLLFQQIVKIEYRKESIYFYKILNNEVRFNIVSLLKVNEKLNSGRFCLLFSNNTELIIFAFTKKKRMELKNFIQAIAALKREITKDEMEGIKFSVMFGKPEKL